MDWEMPAKFVEMLGYVKRALNFEDEATVNPVPIALGMPLAYAWNQYGTSTFGTLWEYCSCG